MSEQEIFLTCYLQERHVRPAFRSCGTDRRAFQRWLEDPDFLAKYNSATERINSTRRCHSCRYVGYPNEFLKTSRSATISAICKKCHALNIAKYTSTTLGGRLTKLLNMARRRDPTAQDLSVAFLRELFNTQEGKCFYTGLEMSVLTSDGVNRLKRQEFATVVSIDRVDSSVGYSKDNVVLCCLSINMMKNNLPYQTFVAFCKRVLDVHALRQSS